MHLVAGVDSSTQSCKVVIRDANTGALIRQGTARHPSGTQVDPEHWWIALQEAIAQAGGLDDVSAISVAGQQHGMVCLDKDGAVVRPALLWNDTRSSGAAQELVDEFGAEYWARRVGTIPVASLTATKLLWLATEEPDNAARTAAVCLPHDWLSWRLAGYGPGSGAEGLAALRTDRSDASGTGYWSPSTAEYLPDILERTLGHVPLLPKVLDPLEIAHQTDTGLLIGPGCGDNAGAGLGVAATVGTVVISVGTSGTVFTVAEKPTQDPTGLVAGFADATGNYLPLACTLNASRVLDATAKMLNIDLPQLTQLALAAPAGAGGLSMVPYFEGERTPNLPDATGSLHGMSLENFTAENLARAAFEGIICSLADGLRALTDLGVLAERIVLVGGAARSAALQQIAASILALPVSVPEPEEYVANGAARQAAGVLLGVMPQWQMSEKPVTASETDTSVLRRYRQVAAC
ncbi:MAG: xylulokinase [Glutamicibacter ardleyensis]|uniref:xylulokinase n=1 Tax=Glutamicibacter ardleyensis TaxID=225894 RepID=UPI003FB8218F